MPTKEATYPYHENDNVYDIESLTNIFTDAQYYPKRQLLIISYLDDDNLLNGPQAKAAVIDRIKQVNSRINRDNIQIVLEDLNVDYGALSKAAFVRRLGYATPNTYLNAVNDQGEFLIDLPDTATPQTNNHPLTKAYSPEAFKAGLLAGDPLLKHEVLPDYYPVKQTDPMYDPERDGLHLGYNSTNYDLTMLAYFFSEITPAFLNGQPLDSSAAVKIKAADLREFNNSLFTKYKRNMANALLGGDYNQDGSWYSDYQDRKPGWYIRNAWLQSNRFLDVSELNEHMKHVSLKRLSAMLGLQVLESDKLSGDTSMIHSLEELAELIAYNVSDVFNTESLFRHPIYQDALQLRQELLHQYPALIYARKYGRWSDKPDKAKAYVKSASRLRPNRLTSDSSSAKFIENVIAPYDALVDLPSVSYTYPDKDVLQELKAQAAAGENDYTVPDEPFDVLEDTKQWAQTQDDRYQLNGALVNAFAPIYDFYDELRGKNVNDTSSTGPVLNTTALMTKHNTNCFYIGPDGQPTASVVTFSVGGIHGAEIKRDVYAANLADYNRKLAVQNQLRDAYHDDPVAANQDKTFDCVLDNVTTTVKIKDYLKSGATRKKADWRVFKEPSLFKKDSASGKIKLRDNYAYVSSDPANHEDFSGYYPLLLTRLAVFRDATGDDEYDKLYDARLALKAQLKQFKPNTPKFDAINLAQNLRKLLLNAASGAGDAKFKSKIRKNNAVVSMRVIGQLFAWRIGQAEALAGARVPSTNTDGLYTMGISPAENDAVLTKVVKPLMVDIEPERLARFTTKDTNSRLEVETGSDNQPVLVNAKGGMLSSWRGPQPSNSLSHPALIDNVLANYLAYEPDPSNQPFNIAAARNRVERFAADLKSSDLQKRKTALLMFQWIVVSSPASGRYNFIESRQPVAQPDGTTDYVYADSVQIPHTNRAFMIKTQPGRQLNVLRIASHRKVQTATLNKRKREGTPAIQHNELAKHMLEVYGYELNVDAHDEAQLVKVTDMPDNQNIKIFNHDLLEIPAATVAQLADLLDLDSYTAIIADKFYSAWSNNGRPV